MSPNPSMNPRQGDGQLTDSRPVPAWHGNALHIDAWGKLVLTDALGVQHVGVEPVRAFPLSAPDRSVSLCESGGRELLFIEDLNDLPDEIRAFLGDRLAHSAFKPVIRRIRKIASSSAASEWRLTTDRGEVEITVHNEDDFRRLGGHRILITDSNGMRYLIEDTRSLDSTSRNLLRRYV